MKNFMKGNRYSPPKLEEGLTAVNYAIYFVVTITALLLFVYCQFNAGMLVVEQELEDGLHIAEGAMISANQAEIDDNPDAIGKRSDDFETELNRLMVVTEIGTTKESEQIKKLAEVYQSYLQEQLWLAEDGVTPTEATLKSVCGDSKVRFNELYIYQPIYRISVVQENGEHTIYNGRGQVKTDDPLEDKTSIKGLKHEYEITDWVKYTLYFTETNEYERYTKETITNQKTPELHNGHKAEGATIEASLSVKVYGLKNIFAGVSTKTPTLTGTVTTEFENPVNGTTSSITYEQNIAGLDESDTPLFAEKPTQDAYDITVWQAVDVVPSATDSHNVN